MDQPQWTLIEQQLLALLHVFLTDGGCCLIQDDAHCSVQPIFMLNWGFHFTACVTSSHYWFALPVWQFEKLFVWYIKFSLLQIRQLEPYNEYSTKVKGKKKKYFIHAVSEVCKCHSIMPHLLLRHKQYTWLSFADLYFVTFWIVSL